MHANKSNEKLLIRNDNKTANERKRKAYGKKIEKIKYGNETRKP